MSALLQRALQPVPADLPVNPTPGQIKQLLRKGHSYVATLDLTPAALLNLNGINQPWAGFGLYCMHQSAPNTIVQCAFDADYTKTVIMRRGSLHHPGAEANQKRQPTYFSQVWTKVVQSGDQGAGLAIPTAYFLVMGTPDALYIEDPRSVAFRPTKTTTVLVGAAGLVTILGPFDIQTLANVRVTLTNSVAALTQCPVQISADGSTWETILAGTFDTLAAGATLSASIPQGVRQIRIQAKSAGNASVNAFITGTMA
jgi:hypothetical protein